MVAKETPNDSTNEDGEHPKPNDRNRLINQKLENVRIRRFLKSTTSISIIPELIALNNAKKNHTREICDIVDEKSGVEQEEKEPTQVEHADAIIDPRAMMIVTSSITSDE